MFVQDSFTDTANTTLDHHVGEIGATWVAHPLATTTARIDNSNRLMGAGSFLGTYYASGVPGSADYDVSADFTFVGAGGSNSPGIVGRMSTSAITFYQLSYSPGTATWFLRRFVSGAMTTLGSYVNSLSSTSRAMLSMRGSSLVAYVDGTAVISVTDTAISVAGVVGVVISGADSNTTGIHLDNFSASDPLLAVRGHLAAGSSVRGDLRAE